MSQTENLIVPAAEFWIRNILAALSDSRLVLNRRGDVLLPEIKLFCFDQVDSTMNAAKQFARHGTLAGHIPNMLCWVDDNSLPLENCAMFLAREQVAGRGRQQRQWYSQKDAGLYLTCLAAVPDTAPSFAGFSLAVGVAICRAFSTLGVSAALKWPNDIVIMNQAKGMMKLGGVLVETFTGAAARGRFMSTGIGINIQRPSENTSMLAASLVDLGFDNISISKLFVAVAEQYWLMFATYCHSGFAVFKEEWLRLSAIQGMMVSASSSSGEVSGKVCGVSDYGSLILEDESGQRSEFLCGDITVRMMAV